MKATVEPLEGNKVKVRVEVDEAEFEKDVDAAFRKLAREVRIPGFRPGKAPRKVLEARLGSSVGRGQALHDAVPEYYSQAVVEHDVDVIAAPEIDITEGEESGPVVFDAVVEVRPKVVVGGYRSLRVTIDSPAVTDDEIDEQIDRLRQRFAELEAVDRPAVDDDVVTIDITGSLGDEELEGLTTDDYSYEVGRGAIVPELDDELRGASVGDILEFDAEHPDPDEEQSLHFRVLVKEVQARVLPDADDDFAAEASEFETIDELRADLHRRSENVKKVQAQVALREKTGEALADLVDDEIPEALVNGEMQQRLQDLAMRLQAQGMDLETYLAMSGKGQEELVAELRETAEQAVKVDLALRAIVEAEAIEATEEDLEEEYQQVATRLDLDVDQIRSQFERAGQVEAVRSDVQKRKAFDWLIEQVEVVDEAGTAIAAADLEIEAKEPEAESSDDEIEGADGAEDTNDDAEAVAAEAREEEASE
ncbi:MAG: trigger factor [Acidimicrobiales bacterium]